MAMSAKTIAELQRAVRAAAAETGGGAYGVLEVIVSGVLLALSINGDDVADFLAGAITCAARDAGGVEQLLRRRPGSWEAEHVRALCVASEEGSPDATED